MSEESFFERFTLLRSMNPFEDRVSPVIKLFVWACFFVIFGLAFLAPLAIIFGTVILAVFGLYIGFKKSPPSFFGIKV